MEDSVKSVALDGLVWGTSKLVPVGYGIKKLQITCVVEDLKVGTDDLEDAITAFEDYVSIWLLRTDSAVSSEQGIVYVNAKRHIESLRRMSVFAISTWRAMYKKLHPLSINLLYILEKKRSIYLSICELILTL